MKKIYKATLYGGYVYLIKASSYEDARKEALSEQGSCNVQHVELATQEDIDWVKAMGGVVPELDPVLPSEWARRGFYVVEAGSRPKVGARCDYYDRDGIKREGTIKGYDGKTIVIEGERKVYVTDTFEIRHGRY